MATTRTLSLLAALVLVGCADDEFSSDPGQDDRDSDGWTADVDCDDKDPEVNPGAKEKVNCVDDNCNDDVDEGTTNHDRDRDGYCPSTGDCDEDDPRRNPAMAEDGGDGSGKPNGIDDNCNNIVDDGLPGSDSDQDGFSADDGDCNDRDPFINPGAIEVPGMACRGNDECPNKKCYGGYCRCTADTDCSSGAACADDADCKLAGETCKGGECVTTFRCHPAVAGMSDPKLKVCRDDTDNDCDGEKDELPQPCDKPGGLDDGAPLDYARAMELCDTDQTCGVDSRCPGNLRCVKNRCTRVLSASFNAKHNAKQRDIATAFARGGPIKPRRGESFVVLSTGVADYDPKATTTCPQMGFAFKFKEKDPDVTTADKDANDMVELALEIAVPTNARSFAFDFQFFSSEYPEWVGAKFNDTFWVDLESKKLPPGNISFDKNGTPIRINNAFFTVCDPFQPNPRTKNMCTKPASLLTGTGYALGECKKVIAGPARFDVPNGGSTDWLHTTAPVTPGETIKLRFIIFDKGDHIFDSAVLIDNFRWTLHPASKPLTGPD